MASDAVFTIIMNDSLQDRRLMATPSRQERKENFESEEEKIDTDLPGFCVMTRKTKGAVYILYSEYGDIPPLENLN